MGGMGATNDKNTDNAAMIHDILNGIDGGTSTEQQGNGNNKRSSLKFQQKHSNSSHKHHHGPPPPEVDLMRTALHIFEKIAEQKRTRDTLVEWGVLDYLLEETTC